MDFVSEYIYSLKCFQKSIEKYYNCWNNNIINYYNLNLEYNIFRQLYELQIKRYEIMLKIIDRVHITKNEYNFLIKQPQINKLFKKYYIYYDNIITNENIQQLDKNINIEYFDYMNIIVNSDSYIDNYIDKYSIFYNKNLDFIFE